MPAYWKLLGAFPARELILYRILLALAFLAPLGWNRRALLRALPFRSFLGLAASGALIGFNWFLYVWAVGNNRVVEASLGYFLNPLVNVALGTLLLGETLTRGLRVACALAVAGAALLTFAHGELPWVAILLALSFSLYGLSRKLLNVDTISGTFAETLLLAPFAALALGLLYQQGQGHAPSATATEWAILLAAGVVTTVPLLAFAEAARRLTFSELGLLQFLSPTLQFLLGVFVYREPFSPLQWLAFALIWAGLAFFALDRRHTKDPQAALAPAPRAGE